MKIHFVNFMTEKHGNTNFYLENYNRLTKSSLENGVDEIHTYTPENLPVSSYVLKYMKETIDPGFGFWGWKPIIILDVFKKIETGDVVIYHDTGRKGYIYSFNKNVKSLVDNVVHNYNGVGVAQGYWKHRQYCKKECFVNMDCNYAPFWELDHAVSTWHVWQKSDLSTEILKKWEYYCFDPYGTVTDEIRGTASDFDDYEGHRHDQAILTNLIYKYQLENRGVRFLDRRDGWEKDINNYIEE
jgi:hypothetical protein